jgi:hypothetical protein
MMMMHFPNPRIEFICTYAVIDNKLEISFNDIRVIRSSNMEVTLYSDRDVKAGVWNAEARRNPQSINDNIGLQTTYTMRTLAEIYDHPVNAI